MRDLPPTSDEGTSLMPSQSTAVERYAVDYYWPGTMAGDGRPVIGSFVCDAASPDEAWETYVRARRRDPEALKPWEEVALRAYPLHDPPSITTRELVDIEELR